MVRFTKKLIELTCAYKLYNDTPFVHYRLPPIYYTTLAYVYYVSRSVHAPHLVLVQALLLLPATAAPNNTSIFRVIWIIPVGG